jgi:hypothetical protein
MTPREPTEAEVLEALRVQRAAGEFIAALAPWTWWCSLTFRGALSRDEAQATFKAWLRVVAREAHEHVWAAWAHGLQAEGRPHFHCLLAIRSDAFDESSATLAWWGVDPRAGGTEIRRYRDDGGAAWYQTDPHHDEWDVLLACPRRPRCRRAAGCLMGARFW